MVIILQFKLFHQLQKQYTRPHQMSSQLNCPLCQEQFYDQNPPRLLVKCGHTFCEKCLKKIITQKKGNFKLVCPEDGQMLTLKDNNMNNFPKNIALLKIIESNKKNILQFKDADFDVSKIVKNQQHQQDEDTRDLVASIISPNITKSEDNIQEQVSQLKSSKQTKQQKLQHKQKQTQKQIESQKQEKQQKQKKQTQQVKQPEKKQQKKQNIQNQKPKQKKQLCKTHQKPLQIVCIIDLKKICANCAIFGEHKGHDFKSIEQIEKQREVYYHSILSIMQKKQSVAERISSPQTCDSIMQILAKKKQNMKRSISEKYQKLISTIEAKQKQSMKNLESVIVKTQSKLKNLMKIDQNIIQKYDNWQQKSYRQIKILEGDNFESKLQLLFVVSENQVDVLEQGDNIIELMYKQQENLINEVEIALQNIGVEFNQQVFNHIDGFVQLYDQTKRKKSKGRTNKLQSQISQGALSSTTKNNERVHQIKHSNAKKQQEQISQIKKVEQQKLSNLQLNNILQKPIHAINHQQSLLDDVQIKKVQEKHDRFAYSMRNATEPCQINELNLAISDKNIHQLINQFQQFQKKQQKLQKKSPQLTQRSNKKDNSFSYQKNEKSNKKKILSKIKVPEKYQKMLEGIVNDQLQTVDFTNAQLGDAAVIQICQLISGSKAKSVKLIRNKISDETIQKIIPYFSNVTALNLSQNFLTDKTLDIIFNGKDHLQSIKSIVLCQNKIIERKHKAKIDKIRALDIQLSI